MRRNALVVPALLLAWASLQAQAPRIAPAPALLPSSLLAPAPAGSADRGEEAIRENLVDFDPASVTLCWEKQRWLVRAGERLLKDFGRRESEARQALRLIQELQLTQYGTVGTPEPIMEYWLSGGGAPRGFVAGLRLLSLDGASLRVEHTQSQWCLRDAQKVLFNFGLHGDEARQALAIIRKYGFTEIGIIGQAVPSMLVFLSQPEDAPGRRPTSASRIHQTSFKPDGSPRGNGAANSHPGAGLSPIVTPALPPLAGTPRPLHGPRQPFGRERIQDPRRSVAYLRNAATAPPGWDEQVECVPFNWRQVQLRPENGSWQLTAGNVVLASFNDDEAARQALTALHYYRFTEQYRIGRPSPSFSYFLVNGQPPLGLMFGLAGQSFQPDKLRVERLGLRWSLCEGDRVLIELGENRNEAEQLLGVIQSQKFDRLCRIGGPDEKGMTFLVRAR